MADKGLERMLMVIFGMGGIALLIVTLVRPMLPPETIMIASVGSLSLLGVVIRVVLLRLSRAKSGATNG